MAKQIWVPGSTSLWSTVPLADAEQPRRATGFRARRYRWILDAILPIALTIVAAITVMLPVSLKSDARIALFAFTVAAILWTTTSLNSAFVALAIVLLLVMSGTMPQEALYNSLGSDVIWLMIGAFIIGAAVQQTGLAARLTQVVVGRARTVRGMMWLVTIVLLPLAFLIPSTSGRAAVAIPIFRSIADAAEDKRITRALALLMPTTILVSTISTLIGASSHLIANDLLSQITGTRISFAAWALYGLPFGIAISLISCGVITRLFLDTERLDRKLPVIRREHQPLATSERLLLLIVLGMVALWLTESWHGLEIATVTMVGAFILSMPGIGVITWKDGLKAVSWNLIVFVGAALVLGQSLIETGTAQWLIDRVFAASGLAGATSPFLIILSLAFVSLTSHIYMTSHTARAAALVPPLLYLAGSLEVNPVAVLFLSTVGMDYCLTFPVSSKALLMFQELDDETFQPADLLKLSSVLLIVHLVLIVIFYFGYWRWVGLGF